MHLSDILKDSNYGLSQFESTEIQALEQAIFIKETRGKQIPYVQCFSRQKHIQLKPEEIVRQLFLLRLMQHYDYPSERIGLEVPIAFGSQTKRADIVIFDKDRPTVPYIIVELKKPKHKDGKEQLRSYCNATGAPIGIWTNGTDPIEIYHRKDPNYFDKLAHIPNAHQTLKDLLQEDFTLADLIKEDALNQGKKTLKDVIEEMEDEVLANAGVDVFEESFKLIFTKLYDEFTSANSPKRQRPLQFRVGVDTEAEVHAKIQKLFEKAQEKWEGVFPPDAIIELSVSHLPTCISYLQKYKLFNSNLDVIDEAFEYLINKTSKGEKGQYFTPRYVIDMCVKMLNPKPDETVIDTAAGSSGFTVHSIFHVWKQLLQQEGKDETHLFTAENKPSHYVDYVRKKVFAIDFDEKAVRVARCLNLIAGDGQTNVLHLNSLDWERWKETTGQLKWLDRYNDGFKRLRKLTISKKGENYRDFSFDVLMANPPFAGDIKDSRLIHKYELGKKADSRASSRASTPSKNKSAKNKGWQDKISRHILFIERNLHFLKPGGRMAIVLPQGVFNNSSDYYIRDFIAKQCRILAVVGLHPNTFKPHTGTKTSVLFVQKWNDDKKAGTLCPHCEDYPIFFATQQHKGKDNSGDKVFARDAETGELLLDKHGHYFVEHDLFSTDLKNGSKTADGIAEAFIEFASKEGFSFFLHSTFNEVKYRALLDGLEVAEVKFLDLEMSLRIDAEYYHPKFLEMERQIVSKSFNTLEALGMLISGPFGSAFTVDNYDLESHFRYVRGKDVKSFFLRDDDNVYIPAEDYDRLVKYALSEEELLISVVGTLGNVAIVRQSDLPAIFSCKSTVFKSKNINPFYLLTFLNSCYGKNLIIRGTRGTVQTGLNLDDLKKMKVYIPYNSFQLSIEQLIKTANFKLQESKTLYTQAESLLLQEIGLDNWQPPILETTELKLSQILEDNPTFRIDSEYFQTKYLHNIRLIKSYPNGSIALGDVIKSITGGATPLGANYLEKGIPFLRVQNIKPNYIDDSDLVYISKKDDAKLKRSKLKENDVLFSITGSYGNAAVVNKEFVDCNINQHSVKLTLTGKTFSPYFLAVFLNSRVGRLQSDKYIVGITRPALDYESIKKFEIPLVPYKFQIKIEELIKTAYKKSREGKMLLELAKQAVELAIEQGEKAAMALLNDPKNEVIA